MKTLNIVVLFVVGIFFAGCDKWNPNPANMNGKITEIQNGDKTTIGKFTYNRNGDVKESWYTGDSYSDNEKQVYTYIFNSEGQLKQKKGYEPGIIYMSSIIGAMGKDVDYSYEYDSEGRIIKIRVDFDYDDKYNADYSRLTTFLYPEKTIVISSTNIIDPLSNSIAGFWDYHFDQKGNIEKTVGYYMVSNTEKRINQESVFTYDSKKSPYNVEPGPVSRNNVLSEVNTVYNYDEQGNRSIAYVSEFTYEYTYNSDGYPISQTKTNPNETKITYYFKYE